MGWNNMLHILGAILVIWTCSGTGIYISNHYTNMANELMSLLQAANIIRGEIKYAASELPEVFAHAADRSCGSIKMWLVNLSDKTLKCHDRSFMEIWEAEMQTLKRYSSLNEKQLGNVHELGNVLGYLDVASQLNGLSLWEENVRFEYEVLRDKLVHIKKMATLLGFLTGIIIVIIFI